MIPTDPNTAVSTLSTLYHSGAWLCLGILVAYLALRYASQHVAWLEAPGRAHYVSIGLGALALIAAPASQGTTPNAAMLVSAVTGALLLLLPGASSRAKTPQSGSARLTLIALLALVAVATVGMMPACSWFRGSVEPAATDVYDCAKVDFTLAVAVDVTETIVAAVAAGTVTQAVTALAEKYGAPIVACALGDLAKPTAAAGGSAVMATAPNPIAQAAARQLQARGWRIK